MPVVSAANLKGGVGKSSLVLHGAGSLARMGKRVLVVDNDPQGSASSGLIGVEEVARLDPADTIAAIHAGDAPFPDAVIRQTNFPGIDLLCGSWAAARYNVPEPELAPAEEQLRLRAFLDEVRDRYDLVWIDNPPNLHMATWSSLAASDVFVVPVQPEDFGSQGTAHVLAAAERVRATINPGLVLAGVVITMLSPRRALHQLYTQKLIAQFGPMMFTAAVPERPEFAEAIAGRQPVAFYKPRCAAAKDMQAVVGELLDRLARLEGERAGEAA
jgi:chromosome partitioning protein